MVCYKSRAPGARCGGVVVWAAGLQNRRVSWTFSRASLACLSGQDRSVSPWQSVPLLPSVFYSQQWSFETCHHHASSSRLVTGLRNSIKNIKAHSEWQCRGQRQSPSAGDGTSASPTCPLAAQHHYMLSFWAKVSHLFAAKAPVLREKKQGV